MYKLLILTTLILLVSLSQYAQNNCSINGTIIDQKTGKPLSGASIQIANSTLGTSTNNKGKFELNIPCSDITLEVSFIGYKPAKKTFNSLSQNNIKILLEPSDVFVESINVSAEKSNKNIRSNEVGTIKLDQKEINDLPSLLGKPDVIAGIRLTPGIQSGGEGNAGIYVRGGDAGQNLILLDDMPLYNPSHLLGFFPAFNSDIISSVSVSKGAIQAYYGGKTSSVIDIKIKDQASEKFTGKGSLGFLSADLTLESPFHNNKGYILVSGRRTYLEALKPVVSSAIKSTKDFFNKTNYYFYDASFKLKYRLNSKNRIFITGFSGKDDYYLSELGFNVSNSMNWGNTSIALRFNHIFNSNLSSNTIMGFTQYGFDLSASFNDYSFNLSSSVFDYFAKFDLNYRISELLKINTGFNYIKHQLNPSNVSAEIQNVNQSNQLELHSDEMAAYIQGNFNFSSKLSLNGGLRLTRYRHLGPYTKFMQNNIGQTNDSVFYTKNELVKAYNTFSPNASLVYILNNNSSIKTSAGISHQYIHLASVSSVSLPTDLWIPSTDYIKPQKVNIASLGYFQNFLNHVFESSVEIYYKKLNHQLDFVNGIFENFDNTKIESNIIEGEGSSYGIEFFLKKQKGKFTGWASYTLSRTWRKFELLNNEAFPAKYDRVHDLSITLNHKIGKRLSLSAVFIYATGNALTLPVGRYFIQGNLGNEYTDINSFRMPPYHRMDISANYQLKKKGRVESNLNFSVYNLYNRQNPYFIYYKVDGDIEQYFLRVRPQQISLFPILPTLTWNFKF